MTFWSNTCFAALTVVLLVSVGGYASADEAQVPAEEAESELATQGETQEARRTSPVGLEEIVVTARKVEENLQSTPISISTFTADELAENSVYEVKDIGAMTSNMRFENVPGTGSTATITIRGVSQADLLITGDPSVGVYIDSIYNARLIGANFNLLDVERVEVLKGPQGTLYGKNTPAGALLIHSKKPDGSFGGFAKVVVGEDGRTDAIGALQFPILGETLSFRLAAQSEHHDGYIDNKGSSIPQDTFGIAPILSTGDARDDSNQGLRGTLRWLPNESSEVIARAYYFRQRSNTANPHILSATDPTLSGSTVDLNFVDPVVHDQIAQMSDNDTTFTNFAGREEVSYDGGSLEASYDLSEDMTLKYIGGYRAYTERRAIDSDGTPFPLFENRPGNPTREKSRQATHELTLSGTGLGDKLAYTSGLYFFDERGSTRSTSVFGAFNAFASFGGSFQTELHSFANLVSRVRSWGAFGQATYYLTDKLSGTAGLRTTYERRRMDRDFATIIPAFGTFIPGSVRGLKERWDRVTWLASLEYQATEDLFGYAKVSTGFRSGGFNGRGRSFTDAAPFDEENVTTYEAGLKSEWLDRRVRANLALYFSKYKQIQTTALVPSASGIATVIENSGTADVSGLEFELFTRLFEGFDLNGTIAYNNFRYVKGIFAGGIKEFTPGMPEPSSRAYPSNAPKFTYTISARYTLPEFDFGTVDARFDWSFQSDNEASGTRVGRNAEFLPAAAFTDNVRQNQYGIMNARLSLTMPQFNSRLSFFVRNLFDREYFAGAVDWAGNDFGYWTKNWAPGRKWGVEVIYFFGSDQL